MSKLKSLHIVIIGSVLCVLVGVGAYFLMVKNIQKEIAGLQTRLDAASQVVNTRPQVEARLAQARINNQKLQVALEKYMRAKMPPISFADRTQGMIALWKEEAETLGPMLSAWPAKSGVIFGGGVSLPSAPVDPNAVETSLITLPVGTFSVSGDFETLMNHVRSWNNFNRLVKIDVKQLSGGGEGGLLTLTYDATVYIIPRGEAGQNVQMASGQAGAGGASPAPMQ